MLKDAGLGSRHEVRVLLFGTLLLLGPGFQSCLSGHGSEMHMPDICMLHITFIAMYRCISSTINDGMDSRVIAEPLPLQGDLYLHLHALPNSMHGTSLHPPGIRGNRPEHGWYLGPDGQSGHGAQLAYRSKVLSAD